LRGKKKREEGTTSLSFSLLLFYLMKSTGERERKKQPCEKKAKQHTPWSGSVENPKLGVAAIEEERGE
jgi:hypothetical protein